ncbi:GNAT family N-acetyltransferase [Humisphaera borealis]|uniref:GNAT family N-acetyltransferase n=1 Tax=Humisphaera borealis TaxID=2807512 RepID=A0A7M2X5G4_9BACT|nr:GNAT family N-acetyltransferase [Humisphaera borealis]
MVQIQTERLTIRDLTPADAEGLFPIYADAEVRRFIGGQPTQTLEEQREQLAATLERQSRERSGYGRWAVERSADGLLVGLVILKHAPDGDGRPLPDVEVGWHLGRFAWGNGYATEAGGAMLRHAGCTLQLPVVYAIVLPENVRSIRVTERLGMKPLGPTTRYYGKEALHFAWNAGTAR